MKVLIADDQAEVRSALKVLLEQETELHILDEVEDIDGLLTAAEKIRPDLVLLDWELSNRQIADFIPVLRQLVPGLAIIALSGRPEAEKAAVGAGVDGFVSKGTNPDSLLHVIRTIRAPERKSETGFLRPI